MAEVFVRCGLAVLGAAIFFLGVRQSRRALRLARSGVRTDAVVVAHEGEGEDRYSVVEYDDRSRARHRVRLPGGLRSLGAIVPIVYDPDEPGRPTGTTPWDLWFIPASCLWWGIALVVLAWFGEPGAGVE